QAPGRYEVPKPGTTPFARAASHQDKRGPRPPLVAGLRASNLIASIRNRDARCEEANRLDGDLARAGIALRRSQRAPDDVVTSSPPFARGRDLIGVLREERRDQIGVAPFTRVDVFPDNLADRGVIV